MSWVVFGAPSSTGITQLLPSQSIVLAHFHLLGGARHGMEAPASTAHRRIGTSD